MDKKVIGFCFTGSFCTLAEALDIMKNLKDKGHEVLPVFSYHVKSEDTRFFKAAEFRQKVEEISGSKIVDTITDAEPFGPFLKCDVMVIAPCTGNTVAKIAANITDTPVTMAAKAHLRNERPLVIAVATNDGLGANAKFIGTLLSRKNIYFVPFSQDDPQKKPRSLVAHFDMIEKTIEKAVTGSQIQPILK